MATSDGIKKVGLTLQGGTDEERRELIDAIYFVIVEHGWNVTGMDEWDG